MQQDLAAALPDSQQAQTAGANQADTSGSSNFNTNNRASEIVEQCLANHAALPDLSEFELKLQQREEWFCDDDLSAIRSRLAQAAQHNDDAKHLLELLDSGSPYSLSTTLDLFARTQSLSLEECLALEFETGTAACLHPDLVEGVRAVLVDKDRRPAWQP